MADTLLVPLAKTVQIPGSVEHNGMHSIRVTLAWTCPVCGGPRGEVFRTLSYDGSRRMNVDAWNNPCEHVDYYGDVRREARTPRLTWYPCLCGDDHLLPLTLALLVAETGPDTLIASDDGAWLVPHVWVAAHGIRPADLARLAGEHSWPAWQPARSRAPS